MTETTDQEVQRGKRKTARYVEIVMTLLIVASLMEVPNALEIFKLVLFPGLAYSATLRGLDGMFASRLGK